MAIPTIRDVVAPLHTTSCRPYHHHCPLLNGLAPAVAHTNGGGRDKDGYGTGNCEGGILFAFSHGKH